MTKQEMFDRVWTWMTRKNATQCIDPVTRRCRYRHGNNHCAIGGALVGLVPEESALWDAQMGVSDLWDSYPEFRVALGFPEYEPQTDRSQDARFTDRRVIEMLSMLQLLQQDHDAPNGWLSTDDEEMWRRAAVQSLRNDGRREGVKVQA